MENLPQWFKWRYQDREQPLAQSDWNAGARAQGRRGGSGDRAPRIKARGAVSRVVASFVFPAPKGERSAEDPRQKGKR